MKNIVDYLSSENSEKLIVNLIKENIYLYQAINTETKINQFTGTLYNHFVNECVMNNQYICLSREYYDKIFDIYKMLINKLKDITAYNNLEDKIRSIVKEHRIRLIEIINKPSVIDNSEVIIPCSEYSYNLQVSILRINETNIREPIIDIGCGKHANLIKELEKRYNNVYGIDQYINDKSNVICENWFDFNFKSNTWGTIIAHMSFTNHYRRSISFSSPELNNYSNKYVEILESLKDGSYFIYTPSIPEVEDELDEDKFEIRKYTNILNDRNMDTVHIKRRNRTIAST